MSYARSLEDTIAYLQRMEMKELTSDRKLKRQRIRINSWRELRELVA